MLGEDILDPYGGAFKVTRGLSTEFPERVRATPISEGGDRRGLRGPGAGRLPPDRRDHVRRLPHAVLRPDRQPHREVRGDVRRRRHVPGGDPRAVRRGPRLRPDAQPEPREALPRRPAPARRRGLAVPRSRVRSSRTSSRTTSPSCTSSTSCSTRCTWRPTATRGSRSISREAPDGFPPPCRSGRSPREDCSLTSSPTATRPSSRGGCSSGWRSRRRSSPSCSSRRSCRRWTGRRSSARSSTTGSLLTVEEGTGGWSWGTEVAGELGSRLFGRLRRAPSVLASARDVIPSASDREAEMLVGERQIEAAVRDAAA